MLTPTGSWAGKPDPGKSSGFNQQDEIYSRTDGDSAAKETSDAPTGADSDKSNAGPVDGKKSSSAPHKPKQALTKRPKTEYKVRYETMCDIMAGGRGDCITFDEDACPNGDPLITRTITTNSGRIVAQDSYCELEPEPALPPVAKNEVDEIRTAIRNQRIIEVTPARFRSFPILASKVVSQPKSFSLRNGHAHMYAIANPQTFEVDIFDEPVRVKAVPQYYFWNYGDGESRRMKVPGQPMPNHTFEEPTSTSHVYTQTGDYEVQLSTSYRGEYSVAGGPWQPIPGTANVPSEPMPMSVWRTKKLLVDQTCAEDPDGPACDSPFLKEDSPSK